ncbi:MAG: hypothetical protein RL662_167 [Bacteroidota bacterium]|jgi:NAD+ kinase
MKIGIFSNEYQKKEIIEKVFGILSAHKTEIYLQKDFYKYLSSCIKMDERSIQIIEDVNPVLDMVFSIGGDGTFLRTVSALQSTKIPILGINTGRLGFLADISAKEIDTTLSEILRGEYSVERRSQIELNIANTDNCVDHALNDIAVLKQDLASMITITMYINGELLSTYEADGLIVATPTGSTAYSMSVGGAILAPDTPNFIISAIAPHSLTSRPLVVGDDNVLTMEVKSRSSSFLISVDGRSRIIPIEEGRVLTIQKSQNPVYIVKRLGHTFYGTLRNKLKWGTDPRQETQGFI